MNKAIEKAIENGFAFGKFSKHPDSHERYLWYNGALRNGGTTENFTIYDLIFGTDFIDKLVGEGVKICTYSPNHGGAPKMYLGDDKVYRTFKPCSYCVGINTQCKYYRPHFRARMTAANCIRSVLANIKDIKKLIEYVRKLV